MAARTELPPALAALVELGASLVRRAPSAQLAIARAGGILEPEALRPEVRDAARREVDEAIAAVCVPLGRKDVERLLKEAWGAAPGKVLDELDPEPLAVRPAAQVHRGELDGTPVAIKVRRPGVERGVRNDLALLDVLAAPLRAAFPQIDTASALREAREQALDELDLEHEASTLRRLSRVLRDVDGVRAQRPHLEHSTADVLVTDLLPGTTVLDGARPDDADAASRALLDAIRTCVLEAGLAPYDLRASHVLVDRDGTLGLLGLGVARPVDKARAQAGLDALGALGRGDQGSFAAAVRTLGVLPDERAREAHDALRDVLGPFLVGPVKLDAAAIRALGERGLAAVGELLPLATAVTPQPADLVLARMLGQVVAVLSWLGAQEDWVDVAVGRSS